MPERRLLSYAMCLAVIATFAGSAHAAERYIRQGATGNGSGSDWANACPGFSGTCSPSSLVRGDTYWVADGSYGSLTLNTPASGSTPITIKKATAAQHGTNTGWQASYGDGQAAFGWLQFVTSYWVFDGSVRNENDWRDVDSYGFRSTGGVYSSALNPGPICADNLTFRYIDVGGAPVGNVFNRSNPDGFYMGGFGDSCRNWTVSRAHVHNVAIAFQMAGAEDALIEYSFIGPAWGKEAIRGQIVARGHVIRHNHFWNSCQRNPDDSTSGCTAEIAMWGSNTGYDNIKIYGNILQKTTNEVNTGGAIVLGGNGVSFPGAPANNAEVYNNTIVGMQDWTAIILINGGTGNIARNNIWSGLGPGVASGATANTTSHNVIVPTSAFVSYPNNLRLSTATAAGFQLPAPYNTDMTGSVRGADGNWDLGAFERGSGSATPPAPPSNLRITLDGQS